MPRFTREEIAAKRAAIEKGMYVHLDCSVTTSYVSRTKTSLDEAISSATKARGMALELAAALRGSRH